MALNVAIQVYRGPLASLATLPTTGSAGVIAYATDSKQFFVDRGTGNPGINYNPSFGNAWEPVGSDIAVFQNVADQTSMIALLAKIGDLALRTDTNKTYVLTTYPATNPANWVPIAVTSGTQIQGLASGTAHEWVSYIDNSGVQHLTQPAFSDISGQLSQTQLPTTIGAGSSLVALDCGTF